MYVWVRVVWMNSKSSFDENATITFTWLRLASLGFTWLHLADAPTGAGVGTAVGAGVSTMRTIVGDDMRTALSCGGVRMCLNVCELV